MRDPKNRSSLGSSNAPERFAIAGLALGEARKKNRQHDWPIILEGKRDRAALEALGFVGPLEVLNRGWDLDRFITYLYEKYDTRNADGGPSICLLMDWDRTGGRLQKTLTQRLESLDVKVCHVLRNHLLKALKPETRVVESLKSLSVNLSPFIEQEDPAEFNT
jgi:5S rRNA maturation endonuclease (ribonuclease M5)